MTEPPIETPEGINKSKDDNQCSLDLIHSHIAALKTLIREHNIGGGTPIQPIRLDFDEPEGVEAQKAKKR